MRITEAFKLGEHIFGGLWLDRGERVPQERPR
jgi:hypothetical protein